MTHTIGPDSPLYSLSPRELLAARLELIFSVEAVVEPSGNTTQVGGETRNSSFSLVLPVTRCVQALTSFTPDEILWGCRFEPCTAYSAQQNLFSVDVRRLNHVSLDLATPRLAASQMENSLENISTVS